MVLFVDSNKFRREKLARMCRTSDLPSMAIDFEDYDYYAKPLVTVLVDPPKSFMYKLPYQSSLSMIVGASLSTSSTPCSIKYSASE